MTVSRKTMETGVNLQECMTRVSFENPAQNLFALNVKLLIDENDFHYNLVKSTAFVSG